VSIPAWINPSTRRIPVFAERGARKRQVATARQVERWYRSAWRGREGMLPVVTGHAAGRREYARTEVRVPPQRMVLSLERMVTRARKAQTATRNQTVRMMASSHVRQRLPASSIYARRASVLLPL